VNKSEDAADQDSQGNQTDLATISALIAHLNCENVIECQKARRCLVSMGREAVGPLIEALASRKPWVRWEATKALGQIGDPAAVQALVKALTDKRFDVRWLAAEGLITLGPDGVIPLLHALIESADSLWLRQGAHHVFHDLSSLDLREILQPLLAALEDIEPSLVVPFAAKKALDVLTQAEGEYADE